MNGTAYLPTLFSSGPPARSMLVATLLLRALLALLPVALAASALRRTLHDGLVSVLAGARLLLGLVAFVLRLVVTVMTALDGAAHYPTV